MDIFKTYNAATSAYLALQAIPLLVSPKLIVSMLASEPRFITDVETYMLRALGFALLALSAFTLLLTGLLPIAPPSSSTSDKSSDDPYSFPTAVTATLYHAFSAFYLYTQVTKYGVSFGYGSGLFLSGALFCLGVFSCLFGNERSRVSKTTGADKRTSNFPFTNSESAKEKKKESKRKSVSSKIR